MKWNGFFISFSKCVGDCARLYFLDSLCAYSTVHGDLPEAVPFSGTHSDVTNSE